MKTIISQLLRLSSLIIVCIAASCTDYYSEHLDPSSVISREKSPETQEAPPQSIPLRILAVGNSFTHNAATYMPWIIERLNGDSVYIAKLTRSGCSLEMHWNSHVNGTPDYDLHYSEDGAWKLSDIKTIDEALSLYDWDIIVIQQASGLSGIYSTYQPYLDNLVDLFRKTNSNVKIAWHTTWPYKAGTDIGYFQSYRNDPLVMYEGILEAADHASENLDMNIPSATLIWEMRRQYPEVEDQFSIDGYHLSDNLALYALSTLWYECLVAPIMGTSCIDINVLPDGITPEMFARAKAIILTLLDRDKEDEDDTSVPMIRL